MFGPLLGIQMSFRVAGARDCAPCQKWAKTWGFCSNLKALAGVGHMQRIWQDAFGVAGAVQKTCSSEMLGGPGADFLRGVAFWSIRSSVFGKWFCVTGAALRMTWPHFFEAQYFRQEEWKNRKTHWYEAVSSALNFPLLKEVSQNCCIFDVVINVENWGSLAELLRFVLDVVRFKIEEVSPRIAALLMLSSSKAEEVLQNSFVFKFADRQTDGQTDR